MSTTTAGTDTTTTAGTDTTTTAGTDTTTAAMSQPTTGVQITTEMKSKKLQVPVFRAVQMSKGKL